MSKPAYPPDQLSADAVAFSKSRFGAHYLSRLERLKKRHLDTAMNETFTDSFRAHAATKAAAVDAELEFFRISRTVQKSPKLLERLRKKLEGGDEDS